MVSSDGYNATIPNVLIVVPVTTRDRGLPHHIRVRGPQLRLDRPSFAMTEQPRTIDRQRVAALAGDVDQATMRDVEGWLRDFLALPGAH